MINRFYAVLCITFIHFSSSAQTFNYDFETGMQSWVADFADYPQGDSLTYQLNWVHTALPPSVTPSQNGIFMDGHNFSDDLFFFIKKQVTGLLPNTSYMAVISVDVATNENIFQIGGSDLVLKAGATTAEPQKYTDSTNMVRMNIDKDNQMSTGADMDTIGLVRHSFNDTLYHLFTLDNTTHPFHVTTDSTGSLWLIIGAESMFEVYAKIYYAEVNVIFSSTSGILTDKKEKMLTAFPVPARGLINLSLPAEKIQTVKVFTAGMQQVKTATYTNRLDISTFPAGVYFLEVTVNTFHRMIKIIKTP